jgi:hypothetical protein
MQFHKFALAAALALTGAGASATIIGAGYGPAANNAEIILVVWSPTTETNYVLDTGLTLSAFAGTTSFSLPVTSLFSGTTLAAATDARWSVIGFDSYGNNVPDGEDDNFSLYTTVTRTAAFTPAAPGMSADGLQNATGTWANFTALTNGRGTHATQANGSSMVAKTDGQVYWLDSFSPTGNFGGQFAYNSGNAVGTASKFYRFSPTDLFDSSLPVTVQTFAGEWSFDGQSVSYLTAAVPEPGTYALLLAGLAAVGFVARRRG